MNPEKKAVSDVRALGGDATEELEAFRRAVKERRAIKAAVEMAFLAKGWK